MIFSALILAGGKSSRMGRDKAWIRIGTESLLERQVRLAREIGAAEVLISGRADADYHALGCPVLNDKIANAGPLAGIERGLESISTQMLLVLAVDLPMMSKECLQNISGHCDDVGAIPVLTGQIEPLAAFYPKSAAALAGAQVLSENRAVTLFAERCVALGLARFVEFGASESKYFTNWNSPPDFTLPAARQSILSANSSQNPGLHS